MELLKEVGAIAGIASFLGLALLCLLYFAQARDVRRLRESASFLVEGDGEAVSEADRTAAAVAAQEPETAAAAAAASAPTEAEAFRRAELARQAAERRQRFEQRRRRPGDGRERPWLSERSSLAVIVVGAVLLLAGIAFGITRIVGGDGDGGERVAGSGKGPCPPSETRVAVLNGTATAGLAANFAGPLKQNGYKTGPIGNTESPVATSVVMFDPQAGAQCGPEVSRVVGIQKLQPMSPEIQSLSEGDPVAVVLGDDQATTTDSGI